MQQNTWVQLMAMLGKDAQAIILPYVLSVLGVFTLFGGETADTGGATGYCNVGGTRLSMDSSVV